MNFNISKLEKKIEIIFKDKKLLIRSLTHKSFNSDENNEKLEFLGDRVLGLIISRTLLEMFPKDQILIISSEELSGNTRATMNQIFKFLNLPEYEMPNISKVNVSPYSQMNEETRKLLISFFVFISSNFFNAPNLIFNIASV